MERNIIFKTERLKQLRKSANMTQKEFSEKIGCTMASLSAYENGSKIPPTTTLINIAKLSGCSIDWLFGLKDEQNYDIQEEPANTYSEYIKRLFSLQGTGINIFTGCDCSHKQKDLSMCKGIAFYDPVIKLFLESWQKTGGLYKDGTIDETIYDAWKEKVLRDFNCMILKSEIDYEDFYDCYSELSRFSEMTDYDAIISALQFMQVPLAKD